MKRLPGINLWATQSQPCERCQVAFHVPNETIKWWKWPKTILNTTHRHLKPGLVTTPHWRMKTLGGARLQFVKSSIQNKLRSSNPASLHLPTWWGYQAGMCHVEKEHGSLPLFYCFTGDTKGRLMLLPGLWLCGQRIKMKDQPLPFHPALVLWLWGYFRLGFLASFSRLSRLRCSVLFSLYEWRVWN